MSRHNVSLTSTGLVHTITIDGHDFSRSVRSVSLDLDAGAFPRVTVEPSILEIERIGMEQADVILGPHVTDLLVALGWTPPAGESGRP